MAIPMTVGDIVSITLRGTLNGQTTLNVLHYRLTSVGGLTDFASWASAVVIKLDGPAEMAVFYAGALSEDVTNLQYVIQKIYPTRLVVYVHDMTATEGQITESALPPGVQASLTKRGALANRNNIGGVRMPGAPITANEGGYISTAYNALLEAFATYLAGPITTVTIGTLTPIIYNRQIPADSPAVATVTVEQTMRTMRRRVVGRGI